VIAEAGKAAGDETGLHAYGNCDGIEGIGGHPLRLSFSDEVPF